VDKTPVFTITRRSKVGDTHVAFELEREIAVQGVGLKLKENTEYKIRLRYRATDATPITVSVHTIVGYKPAGYNNFPSARNAWETKELRITRRDEPLRLTIASLGTGVQVAIAWLEIVEVAPAEQK
jgi:hypothetical protein